MNISKPLTYRTNIVIANTQKVACGLSIDIFAFDLGSILKVKIKDMHSFTVNSSQTVTDRASIATAST